MANICKKAEESCANDRFVHDILHGVDILMAAFPTKPQQGGKSSKAASKAPSQPMDVLIHVHNAGLVLPASSR